MTTSSTVSGAGGGFLTLLAILFIALKLTGVIEWAWMWVLAPLWIPFAISCVVILLVTLAYVFGLMGK